MVYNICIVVYGFPYSRKRVSDRSQTVYLNHETQSMVLATTLRINKALEARFHSGFRSVGVFGGIQNKSELGKQ